MIILSAALQITFLFIAVSPSISLEVHSVVFAVELGLSLSLRAALSPWASAAAGFGRSVPPS